MLRMPLAYTLLGLRRSNTTCVEPSVCCLKRHVAPPSADRGFLGCTIFCLVFFGLEVLLSAVAKPQYFLR